MTGADLLAVALLVLLPFLVGVQIAERRARLSMIVRVERLERARRDERPEAERWRRGVHERVDALSAEVARLAAPPAPAVPPLPVPDVAGPPSEPPDRGRTFAGVGPGRTLSYRGGACPSPLPLHRYTPRP